MKYECFPTIYKFEEGYHKYPVDKKEPPSIGYIIKEYIETDTCISSVTIIYRDRVKDQ